MSTVDDYHFVRKSQKFEPGRENQTVRLSVERMSSYPADLEFLHYHTNDCYTTCEHECTCVLEKGTSLNSVDHFKILIEDSESSCFCGLLKVGFDIQLHTNCLT